MRIEATERDETKGRSAADSLRRCAVSRVQRPKDDLIRFVLGPNGAVVPDLKEKLPGRGVWLTAAHETVAQAVKRKAFSRALRTEAKAAEDLADQVNGLLADAALQAFGIANKAGQVVFGQMKVEEALGKVALGKGRVSALIHASDAAEDGCRKLDGKARAASEGRGFPTLRAFSADELSLASGRPNVIHAALIPGGAAHKFLVAAARIERYRKGPAAFADRYGLDTT